MSKPPEAVRAASALYSALASTIKRTRQHCTNSVGRITHPVPVGQRGQAYCDVAVVLAGGRGTRLHPLTRSLPKPLVPLFGRPVVDYLLELLAKAGIRKVYALLGFGAQQLLNHLQDAMPVQVELAFLTGNEPYGTAGAVRRLLPELPDRFLVLCGDALTDVDFTAAIEAHRIKQAPVTILAKQVMDASQFGLLEVEGNQRVVSFREKPGPSASGAPRGGLVNCGMYLFEKPALQRVRLDAATDFGKDLLPELVSEGVPVYAYLLESYWRDVGTWSAYAQGLFDLLEGKMTLPWADYREKLFLLRSRLKRKRIRLPEHPAAVIATLESEFFKLAAR